MQYNITRGDNGTSVTAIINGQVYVAGPDHPNLDEIVDGVLYDDPENEIAELFDIESAVRARFNSLSRRVSVSDGTVYLDGDPVDNSLTRQVLRFLRAGLNFQPLVNFFEKVQANPDEHSRTQLFDWLRDRDFTITDDGDFLAYKGLRSDLTSINSGPGIVNGVPVNGHLDNSPGNTVEIARSKVEFDPGVGCASGLHAGTWEYASGFARGVTVLVRINPADVVSVPTDCSAQKLRVWRYGVEREVSGPITDALA